MGQHKYNPTAIAANKGELPPKPKKMSKREYERILMNKIHSMLHISGVEYFNKGDK